MKTLGSYAASKTVEDVAFELNLELCKKTDNKYQAKMSFYDEPVKNYVRILWYPESNSPDYSACGCCGVEPQEVYRLDLEDGIYTIEKGYEIEEVKNKKHYSMSMYFDNWEVVREEYNVDTRECRRFHREALHTIQDYMKIYVEEEKTYPSILLHKIKHSIITSFVCITLWGVLLGCLVGITYGAIVGPFETYTNHSLRIIFLHLILTFIEDRIKNPLLGTILYMGCLVYGLFYPFYLYFTVA